MLGVNGTAWGSYQTEGQMRVMSYDPLFDIKLEWCLEVAEQPVDMKYEGSCGGLGKEVSSLH